MGWTTAHRPLMTVTPPASASRLTGLASSWEDGSPATPGCLSRMETWDVQFAEAHKLFRFVNRKLARTSPSVSDGLDRRDAGITPCPHVKTPGISTSGHRTARHWSWMEKMKYAQWMRSATGGAPLWRDATQHPRITSWTKSDHRLPTSWASGPTAKETDPRPVCFKVRAVLLFARAVLCMMLLRTGSLVGSLADYYYFFIIMILMHV